MMLMIKVALNAFRLFRVPPLAQCVAVTLCGFLMPRVVGCLTVEACANSDDGAVWEGNLASSTPVQLLRYILFTGPYDDIWCVRPGVRWTPRVLNHPRPVWVRTPLTALLRPLPWPTWHRYMTSWVVYRHYVVFGMQYFWVFHYGRPALRAVSRLVPASAAGGRRVLPLLCLAVAVALEALDATVLGSSTYYHILEEWRGGGVGAGAGAGGVGSGGATSGESAGGRLPQFFMVTFILLLLTLLVVALAFAATGWHKPPKAVRLMGSTTLGCYVMHWYFMPITGYLNEPWAGEGQSTFGNLPKHLGATAGFVAQVLVLLGAPMLFQVTLGAAFHKLLLWQFKGVVKVGPLLAACARRCCGARRGGMGRGAGGAKGMGGDDKEPLTPH